jgi:arylsulfatase A-like enzyme
VRPTYQRLITQLDHHLGRLFSQMDANGVPSDKLIVVTAEHGDFPGDHWLGVNELFYDTVQKVSMIVVDPRAAADATRGTVDSRFVESVDVVPTVLDALDLPAPTRRLEGRSLVRLLHGQTPDAWRDFAYSELDCSGHNACLALGKEVHECRAFVEGTGRFAVFAPAETRRRR